jgi:hypothetical protein
MRRTFAAAILAAGISLIGCQEAGAIAAALTAVKGSTTAASSLQLIRYRARHTRHGFVKCYRELLVGPYRCHHYRRWW